jgi:uncharacterized membrane protein
VDSLLTSGRDLILPALKSPVLKSTVLKSTVLKSTVLKSPRVPGGQIWLWVSLAAGAVVLIVAGLIKMPCAATGVAMQTRNSWLCYSDVNALYQGRPMVFPATPYHSYMFEYPALTAIFAYAAAAGTAAASHLLLGVAHLTMASTVTTYDVITMTGLGACGLAAVYCLYRLAEPRRRPVILMLAMPVFALAAYVNWDLPAVALTAAAMLAWQRRNPALAGAFIGLGAAAKFYPALLLFPLLLICIRARQIRAFGKLAACAVAVWALVNIPFVLAPGYRRGWALFYAFSADRLADRGTMWFILAHLGQHWAAGLRTVNLGYAGCFAGCLVAIAALALRARQTPELADLMLLTISAFLLTGKAWSPQFVLWLIPLAALCVRRTALLVAWATVELAYFVAINWYAVEPLPTPVPISTGVFVTVSILRWIALAAVCGAVAGQIHLAGRPGRIGDLPEAAGDVVAV